MLKCLYIGIQTSYYEFIDMEGLAPQDVLKAIADTKCLDIFRTIAKGSVDSEVLKETKGLSKKQYYFRMKQLLNAGVVQRSKGRFSLTCLGAVVNHAQLIVEAGVNNYWKLKAIDSIQSSGEIGEHERTKLIKTIIDNNAIESILVSQR
jgi:predicted transcriptional regulator